MSTDIYENKTCQQKLGRPYHHARVVRARARTHMLPDVIYVQQGRSMDFLGECFIFLLFYFSLHTFEKNDVYFRTSNKTSLTLISPPPHIPSMLSTTQLNV